MKKFYNRISELALLNKHFVAANRNLITEVIMGRRRIGKTELIKKYIKDKNSLYFYVTKKSSQIILDDFTTILKEKYSLVPSRLHSWEDFFRIIFELSKKEKLIAVFDEFQNFYHVEPSVFSVLQKLIDEYKDNARMHLILVGSIQTLMEKIFTQKEPLYGRVDNFIRLDGFNFLEIQEIARDHGLKKTEDIFDLYSIFGGVAKYYDILEKFSLFHKRSPEILRELFIGKDTPLYMEGESLLIEEFGRDYERYFDILFCLSIGKTKVNEVAALMQLPVTTISKYLSVLIKKYKLAEKRNSSRKKNGRDNRYYLKDIFLKFWFCYVYKNYTQIEIDAVKSIVADFNKTYIAHQGLVFEELARKIFHKKILEEDIVPVKPKFLSNYWDKKYEFDIYGQDKKRLIIGEIKLNKKAVNKKLINKVEEFVGFREKHGNKNIIKVIITFHKISDPWVIKLLKEHNIYSFDFIGMLKH